MATSGRCGPISDGSPGATTSGIAQPSSRWRPRWWARSLRPLRPGNAVDLPRLKSSGCATRRGLTASRVGNRGVNSMTAEKFDVVILGGGNAGIGVTGPVRRAGMSVAMIEADLLGGTCPNRGCTPKKVLVAAGHALHEIERAKAHRIRVGKPTLDWPALIDREKQMISHIPGALGRLMAERGVEVIRGHASFVGPHAVAVGGRRIEAEHIVIATGSKPRALPIPGAEHMITSDEVLSERELPREVVFVGGGVIALEFGHVYARAGAKVTILEVLPRLLPGMDADAVQRIRAESERIGIWVK